MYSLPVLSIMPNRSRYDGGNDDDIRDDVDDEAGGFMSANCETYNEYYGCEGVFSM